MGKINQNQAIEKEDTLDEDFLNSLSEEELEAIANQLEDESEDEVFEEEELDEGDVDGDEVPNGDRNYKTNMMSVAMKKLSGMSQDQVAFFLASLDQIGHEADAIPPNAVSTNQSSIAMRGDAKSAALMEALKDSLKEDLSTVFGDNKELSEEFKDKMTVLFESAVNYRVTAIEEQLIEAYDEAFEEEVQELTEQLEENINTYLTYTATEWLKENQVAIEASLKTEIAEEFIGGLRQLFDEHNFNLPEEEVEVAEALASRVEDLEAELNEQIEKNRELSEELSDSRRESIVQTQASDLTVPQQEKFEKLAESVDYDGDDDDFVKKLCIIKESHFGKKYSKAPQTNIITEEITYSSDDDEESPKHYKDPGMSQYVNALKRTIRQ